MAENPSPLLIQRASSKKKIDSSSKEIIKSFTSNQDCDEVDADEVFDLIRDIQDPEHPYSLECLNVVDYNSVKVTTSPHTISVNYKPTIPHCSQATLIGLMIYVKIRQNVPIKYKVFVQIENGFHDSEEAINKQLMDKERVSAALENPNLMKIIDEAIYGHVPPDNVDLSI